MLTELPPISFDDVALVEIMPLRGRAFPLRILSPGADGEVVRQLLAAYEKTVLAPAEGFPAPERLQLAQLAQNLVIRRRDGSEVGILVPKEGGRVVVDDSDKELLVIGEDGGGSTPRARGTASDLADLSRTLAAEPDPTDFGTGRPGLPDQMPADFGFILFFGPLMPSRNVLDTFSGTFSKDMVVDSNITADLRLSPQQLEEVYRRMVDIGIEDYPRVFKPDPDPPENSGSVQYDDPFSTSYLLRLRAGGRELMVEWEDHSQPSHSPEATALRTLLDDMARMIESREEYKQLPPANGAYG